MSEHPPPPQVLRPCEILALPEDQGGQRCAHLLAGLERQVCYLLSGADAQGSAGIPGKRRRPLAGPSHDDHQPAVGGHEVIVRERPVAASTSDRREPLDGVGNQRPLERLIKVWGGGVAFPVVKDELLLRLLPTLECHIQPLDLLQDRRVLLPIVLEVHRPFRRKEVGVIDRHAADFEARSGVGPRHGAPAGGVDSRGFPILRPGLEEIPGRPTTVDE